VSRGIGRLAAALLASGLAAAAPATAEVYRHVDERGVVHLTDSPPNRSYGRYQPTAGGSGKGINILISREKTMRSSVVAWDDYRPLRDGRDAHAYDGLIERVALRNDLPAALVKAVVRAESNFHPHAVSPKGAQGLMQLMPATAADLGVEDPFDVEENVAGGARYLRAMIDRYGDWRHALAAYNAGPEAVDRYEGIPPYPETQQYVDRVLHYYRRYDGDLPR
jgi:soluble lytic murein transglycosylase-like protein